MRNKALLSFALCSVVSAAPALRAAPSSASGFMNCSGTTLCGVLTVESGFGTGYYQHPNPAVHGLWPEVGGFGSSACIPPASTAQPITLFPCYPASGSTAAHELQFVQHEWQTHGICSGTSSATDFFTQICSLAQAPLAVMTKTRAAGKTATPDFAAALTAAGYSVWDTMANGQVELSACADSGGKWHLAKVSDFASTCGAGPPAPTPTPGGKCIPNERGPPCKTDADCTKLQGCVRCAHSGFCTEVPDFALAEA